MRLVAVVLVLASCRSSVKEVATKPPDRTPVVAAVAPGTPRHWFAGDLHVHLAPFDTREGTTLTVGDLATAGPAAGLAWVIVTPHVHPSTWQDPIARAAWLAKWEIMAKQARATTALTIIPGTEFTDFRFGHFGVSGVDLASVGGDFLASATAKGAFVVVNHPFATPSHLPGIPVSEFDLSFRPWSTGKGVAPHLDGVEVWNIPLAFGNMLSRDRETGEDRAFVAADALAHREHRAIAVVGGSDTHSGALEPTTWVLAPDASEASVFAALRTGATCVGSAELGDFAAHGDADPPDRWAAIGETAHGKVQLRWPGVARLFVDGKDVGEHDGSYVDPAAPGAHTYRITRGASRCGFIYSAAQ